jgi:hypothetical protein
MPKRGAYLLKDHIGKVTAIRFACTHCLRAGQYRVDTLLAQHGGNISMPDLLRRVAADCPEMRAPLEGPRCGIYYVDWREQEKLLR